MLPQQYLPPSGSFFLLLFFVASSQILPGSAQTITTTPVPCQPNGVWGDWGNWSACPSPPPSVPSLNIKRRLRTCNPQPPGCQPTLPYNCSGSYSDVLSCSASNPPMPSPSSNSSLTPAIQMSGVGGAFAANMLQSMNINQYQAGSLSAGMLQSMQINNTVGKFN